MLGHEVYQVDPGDCAQHVREAIEVGYRSIEEGVGAAVISREELLLTMKIWISNAGEQLAAVSIDESLRRLRTGYIDLLLVHQPFGDYYGSYRAMERALAAGKVQAIGVSNFTPGRNLRSCASPRWRHTSTRSRRTCSTSSGARTR